MIHDLDRGYGSVYVEEQAWQIQQIEDAVTIADSESAVWVEGDAVEAVLGIGERESIQQMH